MACCIWRCDLSHVIDNANRTFILSMDAADALEALKTVGLVAGGGLGISVFNWFTTKKKEQKKASGEWQIKVIDAGENMREERTAEVRALRTESRQNLERAHRAELENVTLRNTETNLRSKLDRKDEQYKQLCRQLFDCGQFPVTMLPTQEWESGEVPVVPETDGKATG